MQVESIKRRPLNRKQQEILKTLYKFRFTTTQLLAQKLHIHQNKVQPRLKLLQEQDYIGRKDEAKFRLPGQFAVYYLKPNGVNALVDLPTDTRTATLKRRLAEDAGRSDRFINHCLGVFEIYCDLSSIFGDRLRFFTKSDLGPYMYFPNPLPDAYVRLDRGPAEQLFFLNYIDSAVPTRAAIARIEQFNEYADDDEWTSVTNRANLPAIFVVEKPTLQKKLRRYITDELDNNPLLRVASKGEVIAVLEPKRKPETL